MKLSALIQGRVATAKVAIPANDSHASPENSSNSKNSSSNAPESWHGFTLEELRRAAGVDADLLGDPATREAFAFALREERDIARGIKPARYTAIAFCDGCGAIAAPPHQHGERLAVCPWCERRKAGQSRPKPFPLLGPEGSDCWQPFSENLRPVDWQGIDERMKGPGGGFVDHTKPRPHPGTRVLPSSECAMRG